MGKLLKIKKGPDFIRSSDANYSSEVPSFSCNGSFLSISFFFFSSFFFFRLAKNPRYRFSSASSSAICFCLESSFISSFFSLISFCCSALISACFAIFSFFSDNSLSFSDMVSSFSLIIFLFD